MAYVIVAYYTESTSYEEEIQHLKTSLKPYNLATDFIGIPNQGSWQANTQYKPYFLKHMLSKHYPKDLLYLDADARVQQYPILFDHVEFDLGLFYWHAQELISSTLYLANNAKVYEIIERWIECCLENPAIWDQKVLQFVLEKSQDLELKIKHLPPNYCQIFDLMKEEGDPVIEQFQASRRFKNQIDKKENTAC